ncbi:MAG: hypothetical protein JRI59_09655 [Deltaproteobacteria bacterium]|nr:hypothetical protein [Deltaproteobacteria bacterium]
MKGEGPRDILEPKLKRLLAGPNGDALVKFATILEELPEYRAIFKGFIEDFYQNHCKTSNKASNKAKILEFKKKKPQNA